MTLKVEDFRDYYNRYFIEFNRLAVGEFENLTYGSNKANDTSSSLESIIAYANYIREKYPQKDPVILNAGAGASSWMLRKLFKHVICADPNLHYLLFIEKICEENGLNTSDFQTNLWVTEPVDHVYFDYGNIERLPYLGSAIDNANYSIYVDDVDDRDCCFPYRDITIKLCKSLGLNWMDCRQALDEYGRWGIIIEK